MADSRTAPGAAGFPAPPALRECHVWTFGGADLDAVDELMSLLDPAERSRVARFRHEGARRLYMASRAVQRVLVGGYLGRDPADVTIDRRCGHCGDDAHGRPRIAGADGLDYSVTHCDRLLLVAFVGDGLVGVDAEAADRDVRDGIVDFAFAPAEAALISAAPEAERGAVFHRLWTRKEAVLKLTGHGLAAPLRGVDVSADTASVGLPGGPEHQVTFTGLRAEYPVGDDPAREYVATVATTGPAKRLSVRSAAPFLIGDGGYRPDPMRVWFI